MPWGEESWRKKSFCILGNLLTGMTSGELWNLRVECNVREQNRKFTTEIAAEHHFSAKRWLTSLHAEQRPGAGYQGVTSKPPPTAQCWGGVSRLGHRCQSQGICWGLAAMRILWGGGLFLWSPEKDWVSQSGKKSLPPGHRYHTWHSGWVLSMSAKTKKNHQSASCGIRHDCHFKRQEMCLRQHMKHH